MRIKLVAALIFLVCVNSVSAQTARDFEKAYGKSLEVYAVGEGIWMTPQYAADGRVCFMRLYPRHIDQKTNFVSNSPLRLKFKEMAAVLNRMVPPETRGLQNESFGQQVTGGPAAWTTYKYENVTFTFVAPFGPLPYDGTTIRKGEFTFPTDYVSGPPQPPPSRLPTANDFLEFMLTDIQVVNVSWNDRKCKNN
ncbi:MAG TPA: hypothetical protein VGO68_04020 [Pyrinomonadaceae bacterium]|jgi:hypothetical protein|nr:hypothetical protein [Pyrinomonadaceae bacterium]